MIVKVDCRDKPLFWMKLWKRQLSKRDRVSKSGLRGALTVCDSKIVLQHICTLENIVYVTSFDRFVRTYACHSKKKVSSNGLTMMLVYKTEDDSITLNKDNNRLFLIIIDEYWTLNWMNKKGVWGA